MENFIIIAVFVLIGLLLRRLGVFPSNSAQVLNMFALYISLPALIFLKVPQVSFSGTALVAAAVPWAMLLLSAALVWAAARLGKWQRSTLGVLLLIVPMGNTSFMGVPMVQAFFGAEGLPFLIIYDQIGSMLIFATYGSLVLTLYGRQGAMNLGATARRVLLFPPTIALFAGLALRGWPYPEKLAQALQMVATTLIPLVMTAIGLQLSLRLEKRVLAPLGVGLAIKLCLAPLAALAILRLCGFSSLVADVSVLEAGMPPMVTAGALAVAAGMEADLAVALVGMGMVFSFASLPLLHALIRAWP